MMDNEKFEKLIDIVSKQLELKNEFSKKFIRETLLSIQKFDEKHTEKGLGKYSKFGPLGVIIKMDEKYNELVNHYNPRIVNEDASTPIVKHWEDVSIYALMGKLVETGEWKE